MKHHLLGFLGLFFLVYSASPLLAADGNPAWSPDGKTIAFQSDRDGDNDLFVIDLESGEVLQITNNVFEDRWPVFSPDGRWLVYAAGDGQPNLGLMRFWLGSWRIEELTSPGWYGGLTSISPDGTKILFYGPVDGNWDVRVLDVESREISQLTSDKGFDGVAAWSPEPDTIIFQSNRDGDSDLYLMDHTGTYIIPVTNNDVEDAVASYSPDGTKILFESERGGNFDLYVMDADGTGEVRLTTDPAPDILGRWSPDGKTIAFETRRDGDLTIYLMNADGSNQRPLFPHAK